MELNVCRVMQMMEGEAGKGVGGWDRRLSYINNRPGLWEGGGVMQNSGE